MTPPGGFDEEAAPRGRRTPELQSMLDAAGMSEDETEGEQDTSEYALIEGDVIMAKITQATVTALGDAWVTYGAQTRVLAGETEESAFARLGSVSTARVLDMIAEHEARVEQEVEARQQAAANHRIPARRG
jgi:hypothetical protein